MFTFQFNDFCDYFSNGAKYKSVRQTSYKAKDKLEEQLLIYSIY